MAYRGDEIAKEFASLINYSGHIPMHLNKFASALMAFSIPLAVMPANASAGEPATRAVPTSATGATPIAGKTYLFNYDGFIVRDTFLSATEMKFEIIEGPAQLKGLVGQHAYRAREVRPGAVLVSWQEHDGGTVVKLIDLTNNTAYSNYTDAKLGFYPRSGTLKEEK